MWVVTGVSNKQQNLADPRIPTLPLWGTGVTGAEYAVGETAIPLAREQGWRWVPAVDISQESKGSSRNNKGIPSA